MLWRYQFSTLCTCITITLTLTLIGVKGQTLADAEKLMYDIFNASAYYPDIRPVWNQSQTINVDVSVYLISLGDVDEVTGTISVVLVLGMVWLNEKIWWDPNNYGGMTYLVLPKYRIWVPDLYLVNPADDIAEVGSRHLKATIYYHGYVFLGTGSMLKVSCSPDMTSFPFDEQNCVIRLMPWGYDESQVKLLVSIPKADTSRYSDNGEWALQEAYSSVDSFSYISELKFHIRLSRKPLYFVLSIILPISSLCLMNPIVFCLPVECGERVSYSITLSLSFAVFLTMTSDIIPQSSEPMPVLIYFLFAAQCFSGTIAVLNAVILLVYFQPDEKPIPRRYLLWMRLYHTLTCRNRRRKKMAARVVPGEMHAGSNDGGVYITEKTMRSLDTLKLQDIDACDDSPTPLPVQQESLSPVPTRKVTWKHIGRSLDTVAYVITNLVSITGALTFLLSIAL